MRYRFGYLITATVLFSIASALQLKDSFLEVRGAMAQTPQGLNLQPSFTICRGQEIPQGWVIIGQGTSSQCGFSLDNAIVIIQPGDSELVCRYSPIPPNYVITGIATSGRCSSQLNDAFVIRRLSANL
jgi:hypothetical protein